MRLPSRHTQNQQLQQASMTPMIDVVFLLLIFFVCAASGQTRELFLPADLPAGAVSTEVAVPDEPPPVGRLWINLDVNVDEIVIATLNDQPYDNLAELQNALEQLARLAPEIPVILDVAGGVPVGEMIRVYDVCRAGGFQSVQFATSEDAIDRLPSSQSVNSPGPTPATDN